MAVLTEAAAYFIQQNYAEYKPEQHQTWAELVRRRRMQLNTYACREYWQGYDIIGLKDDVLPNLAEITAKLQPRTGWSTTAVSGFLPAAPFFEMLAARMFPTTTWLRDARSLEYTPEPDIFHDVFGHVPMHAHPVFADFLQHYGSVCARLEDPKALEQLGRLFWFTVEFGLIRDREGIKVYGSGVISSHGECTNVMEGGCQIRPFDLDEVFQTPVKVDEIQKLLFVIDSFDQLYESMGRAEKRLAAS